MLFLAQIDPLLQHLFEAYGLPGLVIFTLMGIIWYQNRQFNKANDSSITRAKAAEDRSTEVENRLMKSQEKMETELRGMLDSKSARITYLESMTAKLLDRDTHYQERIECLEAELKQVKTQADQDSLKASQESEGLRAEIEEMRKQFTNVISLNDSLAMDNARLVTDGLALKTQLTDRDKTIATLKAKITNLESKVANLQREIEQNYQQQNALTARVDKIDTKEIKDLPQ